MADEGDAREPPGVYKLTNAAGEALKSSTSFSGPGVAEYANGDIYDGIFENGIRQGRGKYTYLNGDSFDGVFQNNQETGLGRVTYAKGGFYHGHFLEGKRHGEGTFQYSNGDIYSGMWKSSKRHGSGTYVFGSNKCEYKGEWKDGQMIDGTWSLADGTKYVGGFQNQKPSGQGVWETSRGTVVHGAYAQQVLPVDPAPPAKPGQAPAMATMVAWTTSALVAAA